MYCVQIVSTLAPVFKNCSFSHGSNCLILFKEVIKTGNENLNLHLKIGLCICDHEMDIISDALVQGKLFVIKEFALYAKLFFVSCIF